MALCVARLNATSYICMLSLAINLACVKRDVEAHETIRNCGLVYSIDREKLQLILQQECSYRWNGIPNNFGCTKTENECYSLY